MESATEYSKYVFNIRLAKITGLYSLLYPDTGKLYGYNKFQLLLWSITIPCIAIMFVSIVELIMNIDINPFIMMLPLLAIQNSSFNFYKQWVLTRQSRDIWKCLEVTRENFGRSGDEDDNRTGLGPFRRFRSESLRYTNMLFYGSVFMQIILCVPYFLPWEVYLENRDGTVSGYHYNVLNLMYPVSADTFNDWFFIFYFYEVLMMVIYLTTGNYFDNVMIALCLALCSHLESVALRYRSLGQGQRPENPCEKYKLRNITVSLEDIISIISHHQMIHQKMTDFYNIVRPTTLLQIVLSSNTIVLVFFCVVTCMEQQLQIILALSSISYFLIQLLIPCYLFGLLNDMNENINFAIYSSNWTEMDLKCKKLILLAMNMNNADNLKMKVTPTKIVNMEVFKKSINICYSIMSVVKNIKTRNNPSKTTEHI